MTIEIGIGITPRSMALRKSISISIAISIPKKPTPALTYAGPCSAATGFERVPTPSTLTSTVSPGDRNTGGLRV